MCACMQKGCERLLPTEQTHSTLLPKHENAARRDCWCTRTRLQPPETFCSGSNPDEDSAAAFTSRKGTAPSCRQLAGGRKAFVPESCMEITPSVLLL